MRWLITQYGKIPFSIRASVALPMFLYTLITGRTFLVALLFALASLEAAVTDAMGLFWVYLGFIVGIAGEIILWNDYFWHW